MEQMTFRQRHSVVFRDMDKSGVS